MEIAGRPVSEVEVRQDLFCSRILTSAQQVQYFNAFLSTRFMFMDYPYPMAVETLNLLRKNDVKIIFLSGRFRLPVDKSRATIEFMRRYGLFEESDVAIFKPSMDIFDFDFKAAEVESLKSCYEVLWAIDDTPASLRIFQDEGIFSIGITNSYPAARFDFADMIVDNWNEVAAGVITGTLAVVKRITNGIVDNKL